MDIDEETKKDLLEAFLDLQSEAETCLKTLTSEWEIGVMHSLFRVIHNVKGNAGMLGLTVIVDFTHEVEGVAGALRQGKYALTDNIAECILIAMDRLHDLHYQELCDKKFDYLRIDELQPLFCEMAQAPEHAVDDVAQQIISVTGLGSGADADIVDTESADPESADRDSADADSVIAAKPSIEGSLSSSGEANELKLLDDLTFFQELALQIDNQIPSWNGRSIQLFEWAMTMNQMAGSPIDQLQFTAAIYLHDLGMTLMPHDLWHKKLDLAPTNCESLVLHPGWGYNYLLRIPGWEQAAQIIYQHHERIDGTGYPLGLSGDDIHDGAKILAILDYFFFLTKGRVGVAERRSTVRAVSAINARVDTEFEGLWVQVFNHMIRKELKEGHV